MTNSKSDIAPIISKDSLAFLWAETLVAEKPKRPKPWSDNE